MGKKIQFSVKHNTELHKYLMGILNNTKEEKPNSYNDIQIKHLESEIRRFEEFPQNGSDQIRPLKERIKSIKENRRRAEAAWQPPPPAGSIRKKSGLTPSTDPYLLRSKTESSATKQKS